MLSELNSKLRLADGGWPNDQDKRKFFCRMHQGRVRLALYTLAFAANMRAVSTGNLDRLYF
jgi:hypothetical protein